MAGIIDAITSPLKSATETVQGLVEVRDLVKLGDIQVKLQGQIMSALTGATAAQSHQLEMGDEIRDLKARIVELESWDAEKKRYEMCELAPHVIAYRVKEAERKGEPFHLICANCYSDGKKGHIQQTVQGHNHDMFKCGRCGNELKINKPGGNAPRFARGSGGPNSWMGG